ncbi:MAG: HEPN domain-containing protein [Euryarchaeota archaeon]
MEGDEVNVGETVRTAEWGLESAAVAEARQALGLLLRAALRELSAEPPRTRDLRQLLGALTVELLDRGEGDLAVGVRRIAREHRDVLAALLEGYFSRFEPPFEGDAGELVEKAREIFGELRRVLEGVRELG